MRVRHLQRNHNKRIELERSLLFRAFVSLFFYFQEKKQKGKTEQREEPFFSQIRGAQGRHGQYVHHAGHTRRFFDGVLQDATGVPRVRQTGPCLQI